MKHTILHLAIMTITLTGVTLNAWRTGDDRRDVVLLAVTAVLFGVGTAVAVLI